MVWKRIRACIVSIALVQLTGACAAIISSTTQDVAVTTQPKPGAECQLSNGHGRWMVKATPESTRVHRGYGDLVVTCQHADGDSGTATVPSRVGLPVFGNIIIGGLIGVTIDVVSGAAYDYPDKIAIDVGKGRPAMAPMAPMAPTMPVMPASQPMTATPAPMALAPTTPVTLALTTPAMPASQPPASQPMTATRVPMAFAPLPATTTTTVTTTTTMAVPAPPPVTPAVATAQATQFSPGVEQRIKDLERIYAAKLISTAEYQRQLRFLRSQA